MLWNNAPLLWMTMARGRAPFWNNIGFSTAQPRICPCGVARRWTLRFVACVSLLGNMVCPTLAQTKPEDTASQTCDMAGAVAEARYGVPPGLLRAIGKVESGRRDPATGRITAWPWTINAEGRGQWFEGSEGALAATRQLHASGVTSIDVGCFQINLMYHPAAFAALEDGFDPSQNADYAARFLLALKGRTGTWDGAVAAYHSATPERGTPYRDRVMAGLIGDGGTIPTGLATAPGSMDAAAVPPRPVVMRMETWSAPLPAVAGMRVWTPSMAGQGASVIRITSPPARSKP